MSASVDPIQQSIVIEPSIIEVGPQIPVTADPQETAECHPGSFGVQCIRDLEGLEFLRNDWNKLYRGNPFLCYEWLITWWKHYRKKQDELLVLIVTDNAGQTVGIAPFFTRFSISQGRVIHFIGCEHVLTDYQSFLHAQGCESAVAEALATWLTQHWDNYACIELVGVSTQDSALGHFNYQLEQAGHFVEHEPLQSCWRVELPKTWDKYLRRLSRTRRERSRQLVRNHFDTNRSVVRTADSPQTLQQGLDILVDLHQKRWKSLGKPGCFASTRFREFLTEVAQEFLCIGKLRLQWIELEGQPVAAELDFIGEDTLYMYQSGMDPEFSHERPGWLGTIATLRHAIEQGYSYYDFLRGDESYKANWRGEAEQLSNVRVFSNNTRGRLSQNLLNLRGQLKKKISTVLGKKC